MGRGDEEEEKETRNLNLSSQDDGKKDGGRGYWLRLDSSLLNNYFQ